MRTPFTATENDAGRRLDTVVRKFLPNLSLAGIQKALRCGDIRLNDRRAEPHERVAAGDRVAVWDRLVAQGRGPGSGEAAAPVPDAWILRATDDLVVVNKPSGLVVHRGSGGPEAEPPLDERVRAWWATTTTDASLSFRPGPLHRLDRETSGLVVFSRSLAGAQAFSRALAEGRVRKTYLAVVRGPLDSDREVTLALGRDDRDRTSYADAEGQTARTRFRPRARAGALVLTEVDLGTGRTHQIRVHAAESGFPLAGDRTYGGGPGPEGLGRPWFLHAWRLEAPGLLDPIEAPLEPTVARWLEATFSVSFT